MKKLKLQAIELGATELLTREQLKHVFGGDGGGSGTACKTTTDCALNSKCFVVSGQTSGICVAVAIGTTCTTNADCGKGQACVSKPLANPPSSWCNVAMGS